MGRIIIKQERCKSCGFCLLACPKKLIKLSEEMNEQGVYPAEISDSQNGACTGCTLCAEVCPDVAIEVWR